MIRWFAFSIWVLSCPKKQSRRRRLLNAQTHNNGAILSPTNFKLLADFAYQEAGLVYSEDKASLVRSRLVKRLKICGLADFESYYKFITSHSGDAEKEAFISALTTNVSHFFREPHHFDALKKEVLPELMQHAKTGHPIRIWSAGCSNGQEPYSIAMALLEFDAAFAEYDVKILATDIDPNVLKFAAEAKYDPMQVGGLSEAQVKRFFNSRSSQPNEPYEIIKKVKSLVAFRKLNLLRSWPMKGKFDFIFCRNVLIYFDEETQTALWPRFAERLANSGRLFIGHSERLIDPELHGFRTSGVTTYQKM
ncbi:UNVERIFIED_CONTAM: hypothetical protein GTU68_055507 [Idotea baltica]|nr:hypothetical protein [Idotea baltica]